MEKYSIKQTDTMTLNAEVRTRQEKTDTTAVAVFTSMMTHNVATPLAEIQMRAELMNMILSESISSKQLNNISFSMKDFDKLNQAVCDVAESVFRINRFIKVIRNNINLDEMLINSDREILNISDCLEKYLTQYKKTLNKKEKLLLNFHMDDHFLFNGNNEIFNQVIENILNNSYDAIREKSHGNIEIYTSKDRCFNRLHIKDNAKGIHGKYLDHIFDLFVTYEKPRGTGIGLYFCRRAMDSWGGHIKCQTKQEESIFWTEMILCFPILDNKR